MSKKVKILVSQNGWEYSGLVYISYKDSISFERTEENDDFCLDSMGSPAPNVVIVDGVRIEFDEALEYEKICDFCDVPCDNPECFTKEKK